MKNKNVLIVGAGINGLTVADKLSQQGINVTVVEKDEIGGLARSYYYDSGFCFDIGPHRLVTRNQKVINYMSEVCGGSLLQFPNISGVYLLKKYYDWPLNIKVILKLPISVMLRAFIDLFVLMFSKKSNHPENYQDYILTKYGKTLNELDFKPYTEKFTKIKTEDVDADWAKLGINRAVASESIKMESLFSVIIDTIKPKKPSIAFYPENGIAQFSELLCKRVKENNGTVLPNTRIEEVIISNGEITGVRLSCDNMIRSFDHVVWSGSIDSAMELLLKQKCELEYINMVLINLEIEGVPINDYQYTYFVDNDILFNRIYANTHYSNKVAPKGMFGLCVEITALKNSVEFSNPESLVEPVIEALLKTKQINSRASVKAVHIERLEAAYPLWVLGYRKILARHINDIEDTISNATLSGRSGLFWYNNMDHTIENAESVAQDIIAGIRRNNGISLIN